MKSVIRELKKPEVKEMFKTVIIDTVDLAAMMCEKYVCQQQDVETVKQIAWGQGWTLMKREFEDTCRAIVQQGYALIFISHDKDRTVTIDGKEIVQTFPSCPTSFNDIAKNMADIFGYVQKYKDTDGKAKVRLILRSPDGSIDSGCRFKYIKPVIDFSYQNLVSALNEAIDAEAKANNGQFVTDERIIAPVAEELNFDDLVRQFTSMVQTLLDKDSNYYPPRITMITNKYLGKNKKVSEATPDQAELVKLIVEEIKEDLIDKI